MFNVSRSAQHSGMIAMWSESAPLFKSFTRKLCASEGSRAITDGDIPGRPPHRAAARSGRGYVENLATWHARGSAGVQSDSFKVTTRCHVPRVLHDNDRWKSSVTLVRRARERQPAHEINFISRAAIPDRVSVILILEPDGPRYRRHFSSAGTSSSPLEETYFDIVGIFSVPKTENVEFIAQSCHETLRRAE